MEALIIYGLLILIADATVLDGWFLKNRVKSFFKKWL